ncbi:MAG: MFS transporter, partial [Acidimicrobiia bacterium]
GMGVGLMGCGAVVPLGPIYASQVLGSGSAGFGLLMTGLGTGAAIGVLALSVAARRLPSDLVFVTALFGSGIGLVLATSTSSLTAAVVLAGVFGLFAGTCYVSGFTVIQERVTDALRGRMFATLYTIIRFCLLLSLAVSPWMAGLLDSISGAIFDDRVIELGVRVRVPGVRLTFWLGGLMTVAAGVVVSRDILRARGRTRHPSNGH